MASLILEHSLVLGVSYDQKAYGWQGLRFIKDIWEITQDK